MLLLWLTAVDERWGVVIVLHAVCKLNVHKRCAKNVANNCGINTKDMAKVLQELGISGDKFSTASKRKKVGCNCNNYRWIFSPMDCGNEWDFFLQFGVLSLWTTFCIYVYVFAKWYTNLPCLEIVKRVTSLFLSTVFWLLIVCAKGKMWGFTCAAQISVIMGICINLPFFF